MYIYWARTVCQDLSSAALRMSSHLILRAKRWSWHYHPHFIDEKADSEKLNDLLDITPNWFRHPCMTFRLHPWTFSKVSIFYDVRELVQPKFPTWSWSPLLVSGMVCKLETLPLSCFEASTSPPQALCAECPVTGAHAQSPGWVTSASAKAAGVWASLPSLQNLTTSSCWPQWHCFVFWLLMFYLPVLMSNAQRKSLEEKPRHRLALPVSSRVPLRKRRNHSKPVSLREKGDLSCTPGGAVDLRIEASAAQMPHNVSYCCSSRLSYCCSPSAWSLRPT